MKIRALLAEHGREPGKDYSVPFYVGCRLINLRHAKFVATEANEPSWRPAEPLCVQPEQVRGLNQPPIDKMVRGPQVKKGAA